MYGCAGRVKTSASVPVSAILPRYITATRSVTAAVLVSELLDNYEREQRLAAVGRVYLGARDVGYVEEIPAWDQTSSDGPDEYHVPVVGSDVDLDRPSFAMTEQPRTVARSRITGHAGTAGAPTMAQITQWLRDFTDLRVRT